MSLPFVTRASFDGNLLSMRLHEYMKHLTDTPESRATGADEDTIVAVSSPAGASARGILRMSGPLALVIASSVFTGRSIAEIPKYSAVSGELRIPGDWPPVPSLLYVMRAPASYTREDIVEMHVPGSPPILKALLDVILELGARAAQPGEFTRRAFLNGRIDLAQAEAVQRLIAAGSESEARAALRQMRGSLSSRVMALRERTAGVLAIVEGCIDFAEQDIELIPLGELVGRLDALRRETEYLAGNDARGRVADELPRVILCGPPNAGKSSIFNTLVGDERAIVTSIPGTTRDVIESKVDVGDISILLSDTAGLMDAEDGLGQLAVRKAGDWARSAELWVFVIDASLTIDGIRKEARELLSLNPRPPVVICLNKCDLNRQVNEGDIAPLFSEGCSLSDNPVIIVRTSATNRAGVSSLTDALNQMLRSGYVERSTSEFFLEARHRRSLVDAAESLMRAVNALGAGYEFAAVELREALASFGEIVGIDVGLDLLERVFASFCVGK